MGMLEWSQVWECVEWSPRGGMCRVVPMVWECVEWSQGVRMLEWSLRCGYEYSGPRCGNV